MAHTGHVDRKLLNRLSRIEGQVRSIRGMVESGRDCGDVLIQVAAARAALDQAGRILLESHMEHCIVDAMKAGEGEKALDDLRTALRRFVG